MAPRFSRFWLLVVVCVFAGAASGVAGQLARSHHAIQSSKPSNILPEIPVEPTGSSRCIVCHRSEVEGYARSAMAHSLRHSGTEPDGTVSAADTTITAHSSAAGYWQTLRNGSEETNYRIDYVIGSGKHASGYLLDLGGHLFQSPIAYYRSRKAYDLAPGYENLPSPDFTRPVAEGCLFCHAGSALHVAGTGNEYYSPPFSAEAITCERCHGPAEKHLADPRAGTIINPAKLERAARDSICEQCHLLGVGRVLNPGKTFSDFRPGERLEDVFTTYVNALPPGAAGGKFKVISHVEQLARSTCARESNGRLWCGTCHDPHDQPAEPISYFCAKCLSCHTGAFAGSHPSKQSNCIGCHMPRRDAKDGGHTAFTDHRIQRFPAPDTPIPTDAGIAAWRDPEPGLQERNLGIAYVNTGGERRSPPFVVRGYQMLTEVQEKFSTDSALFTSMGIALLLGHKSTEAELAFDRALQLDPDSVTDETNAASAYLQAGDRDEAIRHLQRAVALDPLHLPALAPLIDLYRKRGSLEEADELSRRLSAAIENQSALSENPPIASQNAETVFKNIQVLKGVPANQVLRTMRFMSASLGVQCSYCHVPEHFEKDDKRPKQTARAMMRMVFAIDKNAFDGNRDVTCYSCHQGSPKPASAPQVAGGSDSISPEPPFPGLDKLASSLPTATELIDNYIRALGGETAIQGVHSREATGSGTRDGKHVSVELFEQAPDKRSLIRHAPVGDAMTVLNGHEAWRYAPGRPLREIHGSGLDAVEMEADLQFPLHIRQFFGEVRVEYPEKIGGRELYVLRCLRPGKPPVKLYFDEQSFLLARMVRYTDSPLGRAAIQVDFADYRDVNGVKTPFRWTIARSDRVSTIQLDQVQDNVPIDKAKFAKPRPGATHRGA